MASTFYWHDYETWGVNPKVHRPSQFAGLRTDLDFNVIGDPQVLYCQPPEDTWPEPAACLITGIDPIYARAHGLKEPEFISSILRAMRQPGTCNIGYNNIRFDDEVTRHTAYRNFHDPYLQEWQSGCSRWDLIDIVRCAYALRPEGIVWPSARADSGGVSLRLEDLSKANNIEHGKAHDALSDVYATLNLAKFIAHKKPKLWQFLQKNRSKAAAENQLALGSGNIVGHVSSMFGKKCLYTSAILPLMRHPTVRNQIICYDLRHSSEQFAHLSPDELKLRIFSSKEDLGAKSRFPIKSVFINRAPVLFPLTLFTEAVCKRLDLDLSAVHDHARAVKHACFQDRLAEIFMSNNSYPKADCEAALYEGFISNRDRTLCNEVNSCSIDSIAQEHFIFDDARLNELFARYKARYASSELSFAEQDDWQLWVRERLQFGDTAFSSNADEQEKNQSINRSAAALSLTDYLTGIAALDVKKASGLVTALLDDIEERCARWAIDLANYPQFERLRCKAKRTAA